MAITVANCQVIDSGYNFQLDTPRVFLGMGHSFPVVQWGPAFIKQIFCADMHSLIQPSSHKLCKLYFGSFLNVRQRKVPIHETNCYSYSVHSIKFFSFVAGSSERCNGKWVSRRTPGVGTSWQLHTLKMLRQGGKWPCSHRKAHTIHLMNPLPSTDVYTCVCKEYSKFIRVKTRHKYCIHTFCFFGPLLHRQQWLVKS